MKYLYKYPQADYPYSQLVEENARRGRDRPPFSLLDTGVFQDNRYWDVQVEYAKASTDEIHIRIIASNRSPEAATLHLLPTLWFRNTWSWDKEAPEKPMLESGCQSEAVWSVKAAHTELGEYHLYGKQPADLLFTENESNSQRLWGLANAKPYVKDSFHRRLIENDCSAVNSSLAGTKCAAWYKLTVPAGGVETIELVLTARVTPNPFAITDTLFLRRQAEADAFYKGVLPKEVDADDHRLFRQAMAGMIWSKQFFHFDVLRWLQGDGLPPPENRKFGRNAHWKHLRAGDVISMPDTWEYPWFAA
ncbi:hypothetical protein [Methyloglobulus sp.]|uniref:hypothetical protein n=1 Tax=Methyloglobulus sp. TaxID=2518622 RepID=UPI00398A4ACC